MVQNQVQYKDLLTLERRWFPLWHIDWYILREFLIKYCILMLVFVILFLLSDIYRDISDFLETRAKWQDTCTYFLYKLPGNVRFILPISMLLGCMWTMATFGKNMEITAMRASGLSLFRCGCPILVIGVVVALANVVLNEFAVPYCDQHAAWIFDEVTHHQRNTTSMLAFRSSDRDRHWLFETFSIGSRQKNVTLKTTWNDTSIQQFLGTPGTKEYRERIYAVFGAKAEKMLSSANPARQVNEDLARRRMDIYAKQVQYDYASGDWTFRDGYFVSYDRDDEIISSIRGTSVMHQEIKFDKIVFGRKVIPESPDDILNAIKEKEELSTLVIWKVLHSPNRQPDKIRNIYWTVFFYRIAFPWSCVLAVFLGIPLATKNERTGSLLAIIAAVLVIVAYIVIAQIFQMLGKSGVVNPVIAGLAPTVSFIVYGIWRIIHDNN